MLDCGSWIPCAAINRQITPSCEGYRRGNHPPDCLEDLIGFLTGAISDGPFISGSSIYRDKLNRQVARALQPAFAPPGQ